MTLRRSLGALAIFVIAAATSGCDDITGSGDATIIVQNNSSASVRELYIAECDAEVWGSDRLGTEETIAPGNDREFGVDAGCWDLRARFLDSSFAEEFGVQVEDGGEFIWELVD